MADPLERLIPGIVDAHGRPLPMPYNDQQWREEWHPQVLAHRIRVRRATEGSDRTSLLARAANIALCSQPNGDGWLYWLNTFGWILEPRNPSNSVHLPFITWPRQVQLIDEYVAMMATPAPSPLANIAVIKARDVGATWIDAAHNVYEWLFSAYWTSLIISTNEELVISLKNPKSYFYKMKYLLVPPLEGMRTPWLLPEGFEGFYPRAPHTTEGDLLNPVTGSVVNGSTTTEDAGRGDRRGAVTVEEAGTHDDFDAIYNNLQNVTDHTKVISSAHTRHGMGLYNLVHGEDGYTPPRIFHFRWHQVPGRGREWYDAKKSTMKEDEFRREVEIDWLAGSGEFVYPATQQMQPALSPATFGQQTVIILDDGYDDEFAIVWVQIDNTRHKVRVIGGYMNRHQPIDFYGYFLRGLPHGRYRWSTHDLAMMQWIRDNHLMHAVYYGDRHGDNTDLSSGKSPFQVLAEHHGIAVITRGDPAFNDLKAGRDALNELLPFLEFDAHHGAPDVLDALKRSRYPVRRGGSQPTTEIRGPIHDWTSHYRRDMEYFAQHHKGLFLPQRRGPLPRARTGGGFDPRQLAGRRHAPERTETLWTRESSRAEVATW